MIATRHLFRFSNVVVAVAVVALGVLIWVFVAKSPSNNPQPLPVAAGDAEIVWLQNAANTVGWERLVTAALYAQSADVEVHVDERTTFPPQSTATPEFSVRHKSWPGRLVFRWYKITSDWKTADWVAALTTGRPAPLAIIGGDSSDPAIELAQALATATASLPLDNRPLLCVTTATADFASGPQSLGEADRRPLTAIYPDRTFRFCFTNRQMAEAVIGFIWADPGKAFWKEYWLAARSRDPADTSLEFFWARDNLRPDSEPAYIVHWADDPYSRDLSGPGGGFATAFAPLAAELRGRVVARDLAWLTSAFATGAFPLNVQSLTTSQYGLGAFASPQTIDSGVGAFDRANTFELATANYLLMELAKNYDQHRPLLLLSSKQAATRRFLRALVRGAPADARRLVVGTGDSVGFNTIYRDRNVAWPIQDLPFPLVLFAHRNPVDESVGFRAATGIPGDLNRAGEAPEATSTDLLLINRDIVQTLVQTAWVNGSLVPNAGRLRDGFLRTVWMSKEGRIALDGSGTRLFEPTGNRQAGTGEHLVCLEPVPIDDRVPPQAVITVWPMPRDWVPGTPWLGEPGPPLFVTYDGYARKGGGGDDR